MRKNKQCKKDLKKRNAKNQKTGKKLEKIVAEMLSDFGYFVRSDFGSINGQCLDIFAAKDNILFIIEVKNCKDNYFDERRITDNQKLTKIKLDKTNNKYVFYVYRNEKENNVYISKNILKDISKGIDFTYFLQNAEELKDNDF